MRQIFVPFSEKLNFTYITKYLRKPIQIKSVKWVEVHEQYVDIPKQYNSVNHDVAIVRLEFEREEKTVVGGLTYAEHYVEPACLPLNLQDDIGKFDPLVNI